GFLRRLERQRHVLEPEGELEGRRLEAPRQGNAAVVLVDRRTEKLARDQIVEGLGVHPVLAQQCEGRALASPNQSKGVLSRRIFSLLIRKCHYKVTAAFGGDHGD